MNLLEQFKQLSKRNPGTLGIAHVDENNLYTVKYLHAGVNFENPLYRMASGITLTENGTIVTRGYDKFFNYKQLDTYKTYDDQFKKERADIDGSTLLETREKLDGSLILIGVNPETNEFVASTTSSSYNPYTIKALEWFENHIKNQSINIDKLKAFLIDNTLAFEYVSPFNQICIFYNDERYVLLDIIEKETGRRLETNIVDTIANELNVDRPNRTYHSLEEIINIQRTNEEIEGFVVENEYGNLIKFKTDHWFNTHNVHDIFFGNRYTKRKLNQLLTAWFNDEIDDIIAVENQNPMYKKSGLVRKFNDDMNLLRELTARQVAIADYAEFSPKDIHMSDDLTPFEKTVITFGLKNDGKFGPYQAVKNYVENRYLGDNE